MNKRTGKSFIPQSNGAKHDGNAIRGILRRLDLRREELARQGFRLEDLLEKGESLRELAHRSHRH